MSELCPCRCGRKVPFGRAGAAKGVVRADNLLAEADRIITRLPAAQAAELKQGVDSLHRVRMHLLEHLHRVATPSKTPDLLALARLLQAAEGYVIASDNLAQTLERQAEVPREEPIMVPIAVAIYLDHLDRIVTRYCEERPTTTPETAFVTALRRVLGMDDYQEVLTFMSQNPAYSEELLQHLEAGWEEYCSTSDPDR